MRSILTVLVVAVAACAGTPIPVDAPLPFPDYVDRECSVNYGPIDLPACCEACTRLGQLGCQHWGTQCGQTCLSAVPAGMPADVFVDSIVAAQSQHEAEVAVRQWWPAYVCAQ